MAEVEVTVTPHSHTWMLVNAALRRYRCTECPVIGREREPAPFYRQRGQATRPVEIVPFVCQHGTPHCGADAVHVDAANRNKNRCAEHATPMKRSA